VILAVEVIVGDCVLLYVPDWLGERVIVGVWLMLCDGLCVTEGVPEMVDVTDDVEDCVMLRVVIWDDVRVTLEDCDGEMVGLGVALRVEVCELLRVPV
jgi:hypothetical protein